MTSNYLVAQAQSVSWFEVHLWVQPYLDATGDYPMVGTPAWEALPDDDRRKWAAALDAARHWALRVETCQQARAEASQAISAAADWSQVARELQQRNEFRAVNPWTRRVIV